MADKKISVLLSAKDQLSAVFEKSDKTLDRLRKTAGSASDALGKIQRTQSDVSAYAETNKALNETNQKLTVNRQRVDAAGSALKAAQSEQRRYQRGIAAAEESIRQLDMELVKNGRLTKEQQVSYLQAKQTLDQLQPSLKKATAEVAATRRESNAATREMNSLTSAAEREQNRVKSLGSALDKAGVDTNKLGQAQAKLATDADKVTRSLQRQEARIKTVNSARDQMAKNQQTRSDIKGQVLGTAAAAAPVVYAAKKAIDYEWAWSDVQKVVNFKDKKEDVDFQHRIQAKAVELGMSQTDMTEIVAAAGQAGVANDKDGNVDTKQLERFSVDAAKMAVAFDSDAKTAGDTMATLRTSLKLNQDQMMELADVINAQSNSMNAKAMVVAGVMRRQGANAELAGFDRKQVVGLASALIASGDTEETGSTALKNITGRLTSGFSASKSQRTALDMLGFDPEVLSKDMQRDAVGTLKKVLTVINKQRPDQQKALISSIFGEEVAGSVAKLAGNMELLNQAMDIANDKTKYANSMQQEYDKKAETRAQQLRRIQSATERATIALGTLLLPVVDKLAPPITDFANGLSNLLETSSTAKTAFGWTLKVGAGLIALKAGVMAIKGIGSLVSDVKQLGRIGGVKLGITTDKTAAAASRATSALARLNRQLMSMGRGGRGGPPGSGGFGGGEPGEAKPRTRPGKPSGRRWPRLKGRGRYGAAAAAAMMLLPSFDAFGAEDDVPTGRAGVSSVLPKAEGVVDTLQTGAAVMAPFSKGVGGRLLGKAFMPLQLLSGGLNIADTYAQGGNAAQMGQAIGDTGGGLGGAALGAMIGTAILPGIGTAIGGALGGIAGSSLGASIGESVGPWVGKAFGEVKSWFGGDSDKPAPATAEKVVPVKPKDLVKTAPQDITPVIDAAVKAQQPPPVPNVTVQNTITATFDVKASGDPAQDNALAEKIKAMLQDVLNKANAAALASVGGVDARLNASLNGQRSD
ncbi:phage tail tape measure protein [Citrobacter portucalensis]|uniref:phage tail tape measure protein n=1 Tax=Citrobacter portucalensis TaxID=1639133 RepID=UPI00224349D5|nr:phage tail tape measure protein [Citrobacter portucalensis]MCW8353748.1 phage tail tape measure protein [Citrobacter portucalensis]MCX9044118.1 phage tail tape measure protein [Citrobacter portucalensis]MCX9053558.1 phage tail tape measure protein [Citrobacter portucalensis]